jgi:VanZ family protein
MALRFLVIAAAIISLAAIAICALAPSAYMSEIPFIPTWLGTWADANPNFRNFPVFAMFAALLFLALRFFQLPTENRTLNTALRAAVCASALGLLLEALQLLLPGRHADPMDVLWSAFGAFVGASAAALFMGLRTRSA